MGRAAPRPRTPKGPPLLDALLRGAPPPGRGGKGGTFDAAQRVIFGRAAARGLLDGRALTVAVDATALEPRHASAAYAAACRRRAPRRARYPRHPKLTVAADAGSHLIGGALPGTGPGPDAPGLFAVLRAAAARYRAVGRRVRALVADAGFDCEAAHELARALGIPRTAIRLNPRRGRRWPATPHRRAMRRHFPWRVYGRRQQVESVISRVKRRFGAALTARHPARQQEELILRVLTFNLLLLSCT